MPSTNSLLDKLEAEFTDFHFVAGDRFHWQPTKKTIQYDLSDTSFDAHLLHEVSHAVLGHATYERDVDLIKMERDAWEHAKVTLGPRFDVVIPAATIHGDMDTYRDWLHERSTCPACGATGLQIEKKLYRCVACQQTWRVNDARICALRRYKIT